MLRHETKSWILLYLASFWCFAPFVPRDELFNVLNGLAMAFIVGILISWVPAMVTIASRSWNKWTGGHYLVAGVYLFIAFFSIQMGAAIYWRITDDISIFDTLPLAWSRWGTLAGLFICMTSTNIVEGRIPVQNWARAGQWTAAGLIIATVTRVWFFPAVETVLP
jgi:hypothetical protein